MVIEPIAYIITGFAFFLATITGIMGCGYGTVFIRHPSIESKFFGALIWGLALSHIFFPAIGMRLVYTNQSEIGIIAGTISFIFSFILLWFAPGIMEDGVRVYTGQPRKAGFSTD